MRPAPTRLRLTLVLALPTLAACAGRSRLATEGTVFVPAGEFERGSDLDERSGAIESSYAANGSVTPEAVVALAKERPREHASVASFRIMPTPVTQAEYHAYVLTTGAREPWIDKASWMAQSTGYDAATLGRFAWIHGGPPPGRERHPIVLVSVPDARAYCAWWGQRRNGVGHLPTEDQWEKAARGTDGRSYPWGDRFEPGATNTRESGTGDTSDVSAHPTALSPYGVAEMAGNVFEWTSTQPETGSHVVKGGAWNADGAVARAAARHVRPAAIRHIAIGFRCVLSRASEPAD